MNAKILLGVVLLSTLSNAGLLKGGKREIASEFQECMNDSEPMIERIKGYVQECKAYTMTNPDASDSSDQESDENAWTACFEKKIDADEGKAQMESCYDKIQLLPEDDRYEAMVVFNEKVTKALGLDTGDD